MREKQLKVVHIVPVTPGSCGMYETAHDLAHAERSMGIDAYLYDPRPSAEHLKDTKSNCATNICPGCGEEFAVGENVPVNVPRVDDWIPDRGVCTVPLEFLKEADLLVSHSGIDDTIRAATNAPYIHIAHGRPYSSFSIERSGATAIYSHYASMNKDPQFVAGVTLWPEYEEYWRLLWPDKPIHVLQPPCNLRRWKRAAEGYDFGGYRGKINVVVADMWRMDKDPFHVINAFRLFAERHEGAKLHVYACKQERAWGCLLGVLRERGHMGEVLPLVNIMNLIYSSCDLIITPHTIATRIVREASACGTQVVAGSRNLHTSYHADPEDLVGFADVMDEAYKDWTEDKADCIRHNREYAERHFDAAETARQFVRLFEEILKCRKATAA